MQHCVIFINGWLIIQKILIFVNKSDKVRQSYDLIHTQEVKIMDFSTVSALLTYLLTWVRVIIHNIEYALGKYDEHSAALEAATADD